jgi:amino acid transporter
MNLRHPSRLIPLAVIVGVAVAVGLYLTNHLLIRALLFGAVGAAAVYVVFQPGGPMPRRRG